MKPEIAERRTTPTLLGMKAAHAHEARVSRPTRKGRGFLLAAPLLLAAACTPSPNQTIGEPPDPHRAGPVSAGHEVRLRSRILGEERTLRVHLPESYEGSTFRYPVLYLLDAESEFLHTVGVVDFLAGIDRIPELILIGVVNTNRSRDLTPVSTNLEETAFWDTVGGADRFRDFLREELIPFVDREYRTEPFRIVRGQSFGGLFAVHDYMSDSPAFDAILVSSPAVGWNHRRLIERAPEFFTRGVPRPIYLASAGRDFPGSRADILEFVRVVAAARPDTTRWRHETFDREGHYSLAHLSTYRGLEFLYAAWPVPDEVVASADFAAYERHFAMLSERFGYPIRIPLRSIIRLGNHLLRERRYGEGIAVFEEGLKLYSDHPRAHWHTGEAYSLAGRISEARAHFRAALDVAVRTAAPDLEQYETALESLEGPEPGGAP